jgi:hypothetical protein
VAPARLALSADTDYTLARDGTRQARSVLSGTGLGAMIGRAVAQGLESSDRPVIAKRFIEQAGLLGTGDYAFPNPRELSDNYAILASFQIAKPVELGAPLRIFPLVGGFGASRRAPLYLDAGRLSPYSRRP